jgi:hypothetical protein
LALTILAVMHAWKVGRQEVFRYVYGRNHVTDAELATIARSKRVARVGRQCGLHGRLAERHAGRTAPPRRSANRCLHQAWSLLSILT